MTGGTGRDSKPRLLVVGAGPFQIELLQAAQALATLVVVDGSATAPGLALADEPHVIDVRDLDAVVALARTARIDGVLTGASDVAVPAVSAVVDALGLIGLPSVVSERCRDKQQAFEAVSAAGLPVPVTRAVSGLDDARAAVQALGGYPVVIKPRSGGGGRGVSVVRSDAELVDAVTRAQAGYLGLGTSGVLVQEWIGGRSLGAEVFFVDGRLREAVVLDDQFDADYVSPVGHSLPPDVDVRMIGLVQTAVEDFGVALGLTTGAVNFDLRVVGERVVLIEVNPRLGGNSITALVSHAYGAELARAAVLCALGRDPNPALARRHLTPIAARLIMQRGRGIAHVPAKARELADRPEVIALDLTVRDGEPTTVHVDDFCLLGRCVVRGKTAADAAALAEEIAHAISASVTIEHEDAAQGAAR